MKDRSDATPSAARQQLDSALVERVLVLDGAMGTLLQSRGLEESDFRGERFVDHPRDLKGNFEALVLTQPAVLSETHGFYLEAGADVIETGTFNANAIVQADYGLESVVYDINLQAATIAKEAASDWSRRTPGKPRYVAGAIGPTNKPLSISPDVNDPAARTITFDAVRDAYVEQTRGLVDGGCDLLLVETVFDTLNAKAAILAIGDVLAEKGVDLPLMISVTITDRSGRTLSGQTIDAFWVSVAHAKPFSVGINCSLGADEMRPYIAELSRIAPCYVSCYPNAGLPNAFGGYDELPDQTSQLLQEFAESEFVNIVGGCCGTTPRSYPCHCQCGRGDLALGLALTWVRHTRSSAGSRPWRSGLIATSSWSANGQTSPARVGSPDSSRPVTTPMRSTWR